MLNIITNMEKIEEVFNQKITQIDKSLNGLSDYVQKMSVDSEVNLKKVESLRLRLEELEAMETITRANGNRIDGIKKTLKEREKEINLIEAEVSKFDNSMSQLGIIESKMESLEEDLNRKGAEVDLLQIEVSKPKKWWKNSSHLISLMAILISICATLHTVQNEKKKGLIAQELRVKEIIQRLTEIQTLYISAGDQLGAVQQTTSAEVSNLIDEAVKLSEKSVDYLNDSEYYTLIHMAYSINKTENLEQLFEYALSKVDDTPTEYGLLNYKAKYFFEIKNQPELGREMIAQVLEKSEKQAVSAAMKKVNIANEYWVWSSLEFGIDDFEMTDSLLTIAENLVIHADDSWKYETSPVVTQLKASRDYLEKIKTNKTNSK